MSFIDSIFLSKKKEFFWDDDVVDLESGKIVSLGKNLPLCSQCSQPLDQGFGINSPVKKQSSYQTITKSTTITHGINSKQSLTTRSSTPSTKTST
ncbi:unnamed protein product, partial [Brachionus calyciflorus]